MLKINDVFWTFQGEGKQMGRRALFIRMPFCNLKCSWCDTEFNTFKNYSEDDLRDIALLEPAKFAVITGGEPMMNKQVPKVIEILKGLGFYIACESNGTFPIFEGIDFPTVSPKKDADYDIHPNAFTRAEEFKYVVDDDFTFDILARHNINDGRTYSLSPEFNNMKKQLERIQKFISKNPAWRISLQTHKWMEIK